MSSPGNTPPMAAQQLLDDEAILNAAIEAMNLNGVVDFGLPDSNTFDITESDVQQAYQAVLSDFGGSSATEPATPARHVATEEPITPVDKITGTVESSGDSSKQGDELSGLYKEFERKLELKSGEFQTDDKAKVLIVMSPLSYKHVFSRWWINRRYLSSIVERPQRLMACSLGIGAAMSILPDSFTLKESKKRTKLNVDHVTKIHGTSWPKRIYDLCEQSKEKLENREIEVPEDWNYGDIYLTSATVDALEGVVGSVETAVDSLLKGHEEDQVDRAFVTIRPPGHHSHPCVPSGFCLINNVHIAIEYAKQTYGLTHAVILDFDLHHGDGTQDICWALAGHGSQFDSDESSEERTGGNDDDASETEVLAKKTSYAPAPESEEGADSTGSTPSKVKVKASKKKDILESETEANTDIGIGYFSLHDINSFPTELGYATAENIKNGSVCLMSHNMCIWNVHLEPYETVPEFFENYDDSYSILFKKARKYLSKSRDQARKDGKPFKALVLFSAGFDASEYEGQGMQRHEVHVPTSFYNRFTRDGLEIAKEFANGKVLSLLEGGYSDKALSTGIFSHMTGLDDRAWDDRWITPAVAKEFERGCKMRWSGCSGPFKKDNELYSRDIDKGIRAGRSLWPQEIKDQIAGSTLGRMTSMRPSKSGISSNVDVLATPSRVLRDRSKLHTPFGK